ncbi:MAG: TIGR03435 family protein, partial [Limisphaerales bacterium]
FGSIASMLELSLDKPVVDETGLDGIWAAEINWQMTPEELASEAAPKPANVIAVVREQLGLQLKIDKRTLPTLRITKPLR